ncbi:hypothetical protein ACQR5W_11535 [Xanthomonas sacchari]
MANIKYADPSYTDTNATDDDRVMLRTGAGADARAPLVQPKGYIDGLRMVWVSGTQMQITAGAAYIPGPKRIVELSAAVTKTPALSASTWYHMYLYLNGTTPDIEVTTTAPAAAYYGTARAKTGDSSRRYIGSIRTTSSSQIINFMHSPGAGAVKYLSDINGNGLKVLDNGTSTSSATVSVAGVVPITAFTMEGFAENSGSSIIYINSPDMGPASPSSILQFLRPNGLLFGDIALASQQFNYSLNTSSSNGLTVWCVGYKYMR